MKYAGLIFRGVVRIVALAFAVLLITGPTVVSQIYIAPAPKYEVDELKRRLDGVEAQGLDRRMAVLETRLVAVEEKLSDQVTWAKVSSTGVGALIVEALVRRRKKPEDE